MVTKLFVGKLSFDTTNDTLQTLFEQYGGVVSAEVIINRDIGRSKGFGFVEMETKEAAEAAISALDGQEFEGRTITVSIARPREDRPQGSAGFGNQSWRR